ncbi:AAA family ATPase [Acidianus sulfidivorans]|uniref:AAA family ATPase n=1 Tax=Acidianus sulfidivorans TaxID=312539 RepID=UPI001F0EAEB7|nr:ATP-binding protein [Acidianus sulfidivorans]
MGLLYDYLKIEDPSAPLYGRAFSTIELKPFTRDMAVKFLRRGFEDANVNFEEYDLVYNKIGGIPGWLTYFGFTFINCRNLEKSLNITLDYAKQLIIKEFDNFLKGREVARKRYLTIMKILAKCGKWSDVKIALELEEGHEISDSEVYNYLNQLIRHSWIVKENEKYCPAEPLIGNSFS